MNVHGLRVMDLRTTKPDGSPWDFSCKQDRDLAYRMVQDEDPDWIVGAPPCTDFSSLNFGLNFPKMPAEEVQRRLIAAMVHIDFVCRIYKSQIRRGKWFLHEHPRSARSWRTKPIRKMLARDDVYVAK